MIRSPGLRTNFFLNMVMLHVKLKGTNGAYTNVIANSLTADRPMTPGSEPKGQIVSFLIAVMLYIKLKEMERKAPCKKILN